MRVFICLCNVSKIMRSTSFFYKLYTLWKSYFTITRLCAMSNTIKCSSKVNIMCSDYNNSSSARCHEENKKFRARTRLAQSPEISSSTVCENFSDSYRKRQTCSNSLDNGLQKKRIEKGHLCNTLRFHFTRNWLKFTAFQSSPIYESKYATKLTESKLLTLICLNWKSSRWSRVFPYNLTSLSLPTA